MDLRFSVSLYSSGVVKTFILRWLLVLGWIGLLGGVILVLSGIDAGIAEPPKFLEPNTWLDWIQGLTAFEAFTSLARVFVLALGWYLLVVSVLVALTQAKPAGLPARLVSRLALPALRRGMKYLMAPTLMGISVMGPSMAISPVGASDIESSGIESNTVASSAPTMTRIETGRDASVVPVANPIREWKVKPGDHLWAIAETVMSEAGASNLDNAQVGRYWAELIEANRDRLPDPANPDLIFADQLLVIPSPTVASR